jgi:hypothetical protein
MGAVSVGVVPGFSEQLMTVMVLMSHWRDVRQRLNWVQQKVPHAA